jgi:predicted nucleotidyltransferase
MLDVLNDVERRTLDAYVSLVAERLGGRLVAIRVFGSVARGESWPVGMPIRSDLDLLVLVARPLSEQERVELVDETLPLFLESGRQISPQFRTVDVHASSPSREAIDRDAVEVWPCP